MTPEPGERKDENLMETLEAIARRKSVRDFDPDRQVPEEALETILKAACSAPVGHGEYKALHLTVVQDADMLDTIRETAVNCFRDPILDIYYGAPMVIIISSNHGSVPELDMANAGTIAQNMMLAATDLGVDSVYIWGTVLAFRSEPDLADDVDLPDGFEPIASVAFGYSKNPGNEQQTPHTIKINRV